VPSNFVAFEKRLDPLSLHKFCECRVQADVCRLLSSVPRSMSACVREFFQRMAVLDPHLRSQLAEWLAYHLSNFEFMWPWAKWSYVLHASPHDAQRCCFCRLPPTLSQPCFVTLKSNVYATFFPISLHPLYRTPLCIPSPGILLYSLQIPPLILS